MSVTPGCGIEHVRVAVVELVVDAPGHVGQRELALLGRQHRVEHHLEQQVAELLLEVLEPGAGLLVDVRRAPRAPRRSPRGGAG